MSGIDGALLPIELPIREVRFELLLLLPELAAGCLDAVGAEGVLPALGDAGRVVFCFSAAGTDGVFLPIEPPMREVLPEEMPGLPELTADPERSRLELLRDEPLAAPGLAAGCFAAVEEGGSDLPMTLPIRERDSVALCLEIDDDGLLLASMLLRRELKLEREEFEFDCVLGVVIDCLCVVIEPPMRDDMEELILPFELAVDRLLTFDLEFVVVEFLPKRLPILIDPVDLFLDDELDGSLPMLTLPDGLDGVLRFVIILLELFLDVIALELRLDVIRVEPRLGIVTLERFVVGARLVMLLEEVLRLGNEMLGLEELTDRELLLTLLRLLVFVRAGADLAAGALWEELLDLAFFLAGKAGSARKISAQASISNTITGFLRFFRANMICLLSSTKPQKTASELHYST